MTTYELVAAQDNGSTNFLLIRNGKVVSRWNYLESKPLKNLHEWYAQADYGEDLSDYQYDYDYDRFHITVLARETH